MLKRLRWMAVGAAVSYAGKTKAKRDVDRATEALQERLPEPLHRAARVGGAAIVARNHSASAAKATVAVTRTAGSLTRTAGSATRAAGSVSRRARNVRGELAEEIERERRRFKSDVVRQTEGEAAALEALLDLRDRELPPLPEVPAPIRSGRRRHVPPLPAAPVARVQRTYQRPTERSSRAGIRSGNRAGKHPSNRPENPSARG